MKKMPPGTTYEEPRYRNLDPGEKSVAKVVDAVRDGLHASLGRAPTPAEYTAEVERLTAERTTLAGQKLATAATLGQTGVVERPLGRSTDRAADGSSATAVPEVEAAAAGDSAVGEAPSLSTDLSEARSVDTPQDTPEWLVDDDATLPIGPPVAAAAERGPGHLSFAAERTAWRTLMDKVRARIADENEKLELGITEARTNHAIIIEQLAREEQALAVEAAKVIDPTVVERSMAAVAAVKKFDTAAVARSAAAFLVELNAKLDPERVKAKETLAALAKFSKTYKAGWTTLNAVSRDTWAAGLPTRGLSGVRCLALVAALPKSVELALTALAGPERTIPLCLSELDAVAATVKVRGPFPWVPTGDLRAQWMNGVLRDLRSQTEGGLLVALNNFARHITEMVEEITALKRKYAGLDIEPPETDPVRGEMARDAMSEARYQMNVQARDAAHDDNGRPRRAVVVEGWEGIRG